MLNKEKISITVSGNRSNGEEYSDTISLSPEEWKFLKDQLSYVSEHYEARATAIERQPGGLSVYRDKVLSIREVANRVVMLLCKIDF